MYCPNCGNKLSDHAKFCPKCGTRNKQAQQPGSKSAWQPGPGTGQGTGYGGSLKKIFGADNIVGLIATILMLLVMLVPFVSVHRVFRSLSFTLFDALDVTELIADREGLKALFIVLFVAFILLFIIFKFAGRGQLLSTIGCVGSWVLFVACGILFSLANEGVVSVLGRYISSGPLYVGFGFFVWYAAGILEIVSLGLDRRKPSAV